MNLAAAANSAITESRFFPACMASSDTPREATTQRSIKAVPEIRFHKTASVVASGSLANCFVCSTRRRNFSTLRASWDLTKETIAGSVIAESSNSSEVASESWWARLSERLNLRSESASRPHTSEVSSCSAWARLTGSSDRQTAARFSSSPAAWSAFKAEALPVIRTGTE